MTTEAEWREIEEGPAPCVALTPAPEQDAVLVQLRQEGAKVLSYAQAIEVRDLATAKGASDDLIIIRSTLKQVDAKRKWYKAPLLEAGRVLDRLCEDVCEPWRQADREYTRKLTTYHLSEEAKRKEAEAINVEVGEAVVDVPDEQKRVRAGMGSVTFTPRANKEKIQAAVDAGVREIPGVAIYPVWMFKVLDLAQVPAQYKTTGTIARK